MDIITLTDIMKTLEKKFNAEAAKVNIINPDNSCDTDFMKKFLSAYVFWSIYIKMPEDHQYKVFYLCEVEKRIKMLI